MKDQLAGLPKIGARIIKSAVGSALCIAVYYIRLKLFPEHGGIPFYSVLAVLWCMQPYDDSTRSMAKQRIIGTVTGAVYGLVFLLIFGGLPESFDIPIYFAACAMIIPIIYTTVLIHKKNASFFSCVVFLSITLSHIGDENPYVFVLNRVVDTLIGIGIGVGLNVSHIHLRHSNDTLYVSGIDEVLVRHDDKMTAYSKVELNRLIAMGAKFTVSTERTPASVISLMDGVRLELPIIAMDGAALFDIKENRYLETVCIDSAVCGRVEEIIRENGFHVFVNSLVDNTLHIYYGEMKNDCEKDLFEHLRRSPYRNYTRMSFRNRSNENVIYLMVLDSRENVSRLCGILEGSDIYGHIKITVTQAAEYEGYSYLKIYSKNADKAKMIDRVRKMTNAEKVVTFGSIKGKYDVCIADDSGSSAVRILKHLYDKP